MVATRSCRKGRIGSHCLIDIEFQFYKMKSYMNFPSGLKNLLANAGDMGSISGLEKFHMLWGN